VLFAHSQFFALVAENSQPVLVKFDETVSYLPVFETKQEAALAAKNLEATNSSAIQKASALAPQEFTWSAFRQWQQQMKDIGIMLFVYPMSPGEYGSPK